MITLVRNELFGGEQASIAVRGSPQDAARLLAEQTSHWVFPLSLSVHEPLLICLAGTLRLLIGKLLIHQLRLLVLLRGLPSQNGLALIYKSGLLIKLRRALIRCRLVFGEFEGNFCVLPLNVRIVVSDLLRLLRLLALRGCLCLKGGSLLLPSRHLADGPHCGPY